MNNILERTAFLSMALKKKEKENSVKGIIKINAKKKYQSMT